MQVSHPTPLILSLILTTNVIYAAKPLILQQTPFSALKQQFYLSLPGLHHPAVHASDTLSFKQQHTDKKNINHIRMQQQYEGFNVIGGYAILHTLIPVKALLESKDMIMNGKVYGGLAQELGPVPKNFTANKVPALNHFKRKLNEKMISDEQIVPVVYIDNSNHAHWAYKVSVYVEHDHGMPARPTAIISADTYTPFIQWNNLKTAMLAAKAMGYGGNSKTGEFVYGKTYPLLDITRDTGRDLCYLETPEVRVVDMKHQLIDAELARNKPMEFACRMPVNGLANVFWTGYRGNGYDKSNGAYAPSNDALYTGLIIKHMYQEWYGLEVLTKKITKETSLPMQLIMRVHYGNDYENAFWDGRQMTFGDGEQTMYPLVSLGVAAHEVSHGFTEQHSDLNYYDQAGGINESFSDMASQAAELYATGQNTWQVGADIMKEDSGFEALRFMDRPSRDGSSIDSALEYSEKLDVHNTSGVFNRLFYLIATRPGWGVRKTFELMVKANMDYWGEDTDFYQAGCGILSAAKDLNFSMVDIRKALTGVSIAHESCQIESVD